MQFAIILCVVALAAITIAGPVPESTPASLVRHEEVHREDGYNVEFELDDGTLLKDSGVKVEVGDEGDMIVRRKGSYRYKSPEGELIEVHYTADENGFRAEGAHLPKVVKA